MYIRCNYLPCQLQIHVPVMFDLMEIGYGVQFSAYEMASPAAR